MRYQMNIAKLCGNSQKLDINWNCITNKNINWTILGI